MALDRAIYKAFEQVVGKRNISEDLGVTKPDAAFIDICLDRIAEPGSSCIMIGDSLTSDMLGAKNASLDSVWFMPSGDIEKAMKEIIKPKLLPPFLYLPHNMHLKINNPFPIQYNLLLMQLLLYVLNFFLYYLYLNFFY